MLGQHWQGSYREQRAHLGPAVDHLCKALCLVVDDIGRAPLGAQVALLITASCHKGGDALGFAQCYGLPAGHRTVCDSESTS